MRVGVAVLGKDFALVFADGDPLDSQLGDSMIVADRMVDENDRTPMHLFLAPDIVQRMAEGRQPPELGCRTLLSAAPLPLDWDEQRRVLGFST